MSSSHSKRLRVFAGPNGSGKSTVINEILKAGTPDLGKYINADDLAKGLRDSTFTFNNWCPEISKSEFLDQLEANSLIQKNYPGDTFAKSFEVIQGQVKLTDLNQLEYFAQILAEFLRIQCLERGEKFSFETVFSHPSKVEWMKKATEMGYKVYLYFVSTESPEINKARVQNRVLNGGHHVPPQKIEERYYRSLDLLHNACPYAYQAYFFDTSKDSAKGDYELFAHFRREDGKPKWDQFENPDSVPNWFIKYYVDKEMKQGQRN